MRIGLQYLESLIERTPDLYLHELKADLEENHGVSVDISTIHRTLRRRGFTLKKNCFIPSERVEESRAKYQIEVTQNYHPEQLVFVDESALNCLTTRQSRGWASIGCCSCRRDFFVRGTRYFLSPVLPYTLVPYKLIDTPFFPLSLLTGSSILQLRTTLIPHKNSTVSLMCSLTT